MTGSASPNTITVHGRDYVLAWVGLEAAHLVARAGSGQPARPIVEHGDSHLNPAYQAGELTAPRWATRTLCGRDEWFMCPTEAGRASMTSWAVEEEAVLVPTCKPCLRVLDREFPEPVANEALARNVSRCVQELGEWGCVVVHGVPADQAELLRKRVRTEARRRGWKFQSTMGADQLIASCENALTPERYEVVKLDSLRRMNSVVTGERLPPPTWRFDWS